MVRLRDRSNNNVIEDNGFKKVEGMPVIGECRLSPRFCLPRVLRGRTGAIAVTCRRAIRSFDSANSVTTCAVFLASPRKRTFTSLNWRLIT